MGQSPDCYGFFTAVGPQTAALQLVQVRKLSRDAMSKAGIARRLQIGRTSARAFWAEVFFRGITRTMHEMATIGPFGA